MTWLPQGHMPQSTSGDCWIRFPDLKDSKTFRVLVFYFVFKKQKAMWSPWLFVVAFHCSPRCQVLLRAFFCHHGFFFAFGKKIIVNYCCSIHVHVRLQSGFLLETVGGLCLCDAKNGWNSCFGDTSKDSPIIGLLLQACGSCTIRGIGCSYYLA